MSSDSKPFQFPLSFDPFRLVLALIQNFKSILLGGLVLAVVGAAFGWFVLGNTYTATINVELENGGSDGPAFDEPYMPPVMEEEALLITALSKEVLEGTSARYNVSKGELRFMVEVRQPVGTPLLEFSARSKKSPEDALELARIWTEEVRERTAEIRQMEAATQLAIFQKQFDEGKAGLALLSEEFLRFSKEKKIFDEKKMETSLYQSLNSLKEKMDETQSELEAKSVQVELYEKELKGAGNIRKELAEKRLELDTLRTDGLMELHPRVRSLKVEVRELQTKLIAAQESDASSQESVDTAVLTELFRIKEEKNILEGKVASYTKMVSGIEQKIAELPERAIKISAKRSSVEERKLFLATLGTRVDEARFFSKEAPGSINVVNEPPLDEVAVKSGLFKASILGAGCFALGSALVLCVVMFKELFRSKVRTPLQAAIATQSLPKLHFPPKHEELAATSMRRFWLSGLAKRFPKERRFFLPVVGEIPAEENFWKRFLESVGQDSSARIVFMDFSENPLPLRVLGEPLPPYNASSPQSISRLNPQDIEPANLGAMFERLPQDHILLVRWDLPQNLILSQIARHFDRYYFVTSPKSADLEIVEESSQIYREMLGPADGVVLVDQKKPDFGTRLVQNLSTWFIEVLQRRELQHA